MSFKVHIEERQPTFYLVTLEGRLDTNAFYQLDKEISPYLTDTTKVVVFDMAKLDYISSAGLRIVFKVRKAVRKNNGHIMMIDLQPQIERVFDIVESIPNLLVFKNIEDVDRYLDHVQRKELEKIQEDESPAA